MKTAEEILDEVMAEETNQSQMDIRKVAIRAMERYADQFKLKSPKGHWKVGGKIYPDYTGGPKHNQS